jgi:DNA-3-methyladenine glycosylase
MLSKQSYKNKNTEIKQLGYDFYNRHVTDVAQDLLGKRLVWGEFEGIITETEAYRGMDDAASHAARGLTARSEIMFGPPGHVYVYLIYGIYHCLNIVTDAPGQPSAVLIRSIKSPEIYLNGPGKICRYLDINKSHNNLNLTTSSNAYVTQGIVPEKCLITPRVGIKKATDKLWRFVMAPTETNF